MPRLPVPSRSVLEIVSSSSLSLLSRARRLLLGSSLASLGIVGFSPVPAAATPTVTPEAGAATAITISERYKKPGKLILSLRHAVSRFAPASHKSHSSHSSHRSHYSSSGGGGGGGGGTSTPAQPLYSAPTPQPEPSPSPDTNRSEIAITVSAVDRTRRSIAGTDEYGTHYEFFYRDDTQVQATAGLVRLDEYLEGNPSVPFTTGQKVRVTWKASTDKKRRMATRVMVTR
jgi:hypothetical protein